MIVTASSFVFLQFCILVVCVLCIYASRRKDVTSDDAASEPPLSTVGRDRFSAASPLASPLASLRERLLHISLGAMVSPGSGGAVGGSLRPQGQCDGQRGRTTAPCEPAQVNAFRGIYLVLRLRRVRHNGAQETSVTVSRFIQRSDAAQTPTPLGGGPPDHQNPIPPRHPRAGHPFAEHFLGSILGCKDHPYRRAQGQGKKPQCAGEKAATPRPRRRAPWNGVTAGMSGLDRRRPATP